MAKAERKWKQLGGGNGEVTSWSEGVAVEGELVGRHQGRFGPLLDLRTDDGEDVTVPETAVLRDRLKEVEPGAFLRIECAGKVETKSGRSCWDFKVLIEDEGEDEDSDLGF